MEAGLVSLGTTLKITQVTASGFQTVLTSFENEDNAYNALRSARQAASDAFQAQMGLVAAWLATAKGVLVARFGIRWSTLWAQAGFINHSTAIPANLADQIALTGRIAAFFTANPSYEVPSLEVTAAQATLLANGARDAQQALINAQQALAGKDQQWTTAWQALVDQMRALIKILSFTLAKDDPRWLAFGLNMPATNTTPGQPQNVNAHMDTNGNVVVQCDPVSLALRYRWRARILGFQGDYTLAASTTEPLAALSGYSPGDTLEIIVQGVNGGLQGVASEPIVFTVPVVNAATPKATEPKTSVQQNGSANGSTNGSHGRTLTNGNGHSSHSRAA